MRTELFQAETIGVANTLGRATHKLSVVFAGDEAATDGNRVFLPALPTGEMSKQQADVMRGFVDHEGLHVRYTEFKAYREMGEQPSKMLHALANAIEDMRIEALGIAEYPGMRHNISATAEQVNLELRPKLEAHVAAGTVTTRIWGSVAITWAGRLRANMAVASNEGMLAMLPPEVRTWAERVVDAVPGLKSTRDAIALARTLVEEMRAENERIAREKLANGEKLRAAKPGEEDGTEAEIQATPDQIEQDEQPQPKRKPGKGKAEQGDDEDEDEPKPHRRKDEAKDEDGGDEDAPINDGLPPGGKEDDDDDDDAGQGEDDEDDEDADDDEDSADAGDDEDDDDDEDDEDDDADAEPEDERSEDEGEGEDGGGPGGNGAGEGGPPPLDEESMLSADLNDAVTQVAQELRNKQGKDGTPYSMPLTTADDGFNRLTDRTARNYTQRYKKFLHAMGPELSVMRRKLERMVIARQLDEWQGGQRYGRLDQRRLTAAVLGQDEVYRQRFEAPALDTAVLLLCDVSGSMEGASINLVEQLLVGLSDSLDRLGVPFAAYGYDSEDLSYETKVEVSKRTQMSSRIELQRMGYTRQHAIKLEVAKSFGDNLRLDTTQGRIAHLHMVTDGGTPTGDCMMMAAPILLARRESRKIMLVLTDGASDNQAYCKHVAKLLSQRMEVVGIGILSTSVKHAFPHHIVVTSLDEFVRQGMDVVARLLLGERARLSAA